MFKKIKEWAKTHKMFAFNIAAVVIILFFVVSGFVMRVGYTFFGMRSSSYKGRYENDSFSSIDSIGGIPMSSKIVSPKPQYESVSNQVAPEDRRVITNSNISLHVKDVDNTVDNIRQKVDEIGGFPVDTFIKRDEVASSATLEVRIPSDRIVEFSKYLKTLAVKVVYENITGTDITDQYTDYEERLSSLERIKERFENIMEEAEDVDEMLRVLRNLQGIQSEIDSIKGQLTYMDGSTTTSKVTITLSTDVLSLPYTPVKSWRPDVVYKEAIRSLISVFRSIATLMIWLLVFLPLILFFIAIKITFKYLLRSWRRERVKDIK